MAFNCSGSAACSCLNKVPVRVLLLLPLLLLLCILLLCVLADNEIDLE